VSLNLGDVQGNILRGYKHMHFAAYLLCEFARPNDPPREFLRRLAAPEDGDGWPRLMSAKPWHKKDDVHEALNVALTHRGVSNLGWDRWFAGERFEDFKQGMYARAQRLGDEDPQSWQEELQRDIDLLLVLYADDEDRREEKVRELEARLPGWGLTLTLCQLAATLRDGAGERIKREHFGFRDGFSQPAIDLEGTRGHPSARKVRGEGVLRVPWRAGMWRPLRLGEFLLGHRDEEGVTAGGPDARAPYHDGTFMVWRKLEQDVEAFDEHFARAGADGERLKAKAVGRWQDGTSLERAPWGPPPHGPARGKPSNDFDYSRDMQGARCPIGAHVRRANPRASLGYGTERSRRHRIIRRGLPYSDGDEKGLIFVCFNANITRQFELIQGSWLMEGDAFGLGSEEDFLLGRPRPGAIMTMQGGRGSRARFVGRGQRPFVLTRGGYYLLVPSISALKRMGEGPWPPVKGKAGASCRNVLRDVAVYILWALWPRGGRGGLEQDRGVDD
jgi:Dyp-type peroxidase family